MPEQEDKKELATNRLLEILRKSEVEDLTFTKNLKQPV